MELKITSKVSNVSMEPATPLWQRVPTKDSDGNTLSDFMMLIPKLSTKPPYLIEYTIRQINKVLSHYKDYIVFVDLNVKLSLLWVSIKSIPGISLEVAAALHVLIPEAKLVAQKI